MSYKIAICISGETRTWNETSKKNFNRFISMLPPDWDIKVYAHTWSHCDLPEPPAIGFTDLKVESQAELIDKWVLTDFLRFAAYDPKYHKKERNASLKDYVEFHLDLSRKKYGQVIGGWNSFKMAQGTADVYLRCRWDFNLSPKHLQEKINSVVIAISKLANDDQKTILINWAKVGPRGASVKRFGYPAAPNVILDDKFFILSGPAIDDILHRDIYNSIIVMHDMLPKSHHTLGSHQIWTALMTIGQCDIKTGDYLEAVIIDRNE